MPLLLLAAAFLFLNCSNSIAEDPNPSSGKTPAPVITVNGQISSATVEGYKLDIFTPENYDETKEYPVIYFNDGQSLFGGGWELGEQLNSFVQNDLIEEVIVVGIHSDHERTLNYTPYEDSWMRENWGLTEPRAQDYTQDVVDKIIPFVEKNFGTISDKSGRAFMGYSLGGLQAAWAGINFPNHFSMVAAFSPSFWAGNYGIFNENPSQNADLRIWFDIGTAEWNYYVPFQKLLIDKGFEYGEDVFYYEVFDGLHDIRAWKDRIFNPLMAFFGKNKNFEPRSMSVRTQVIPSQVNPSLYFVRINPVVTLKNAMKYSLAEAAEYVLENPDAGTILSDGRFRFSKEEDLNVIVKYKGLETRHTIEYAKVKALTGG